MRRTIHAVALAAAGAFVLAGTAAARDSKSVVLSSQDQQFLTQAWGVSQSEVKLGKLAQDKGTSQQVKDFGKQLEADHNLASDQLKRIAKKANVDLPDALPIDKQQTIDRLSKLQGPAFDQAFLQQIASGHDQAIDLFQSQVQQGQNPDLVNFARTQLPTLKAHDDVAARAGRCRSPAVAAAARRCSSREQ